MQQPKYISHDQIEIKTGHKTFDLQTNLITYGNIIANTQYGRHIRSSTETGIPPWDRPKGYLQDWDCNNFREAILTPGRIINMTKEFADEFNGIYLYAFFHIYKGKRIVHGYVFTQSGNNNFIDYQVTNGRVWTHRHERSRQIIKTVAPYVSNNCLLY